MFQWLTKRLRPYPVGTFGSDLIEELVPGHRARMARLDERREEEKERQVKEVRPRLERELTSPTMARWESERKRELLELKFKDAEWILNYEKRLAKLQKNCGAPIGGRASWDQHRAPAETGTPPRRTSPEPLLRLSVPALSF